MIDTLFEGAIVVNDYKVLNLQRRQEKGEKKTTWCAVVDSWVPPPLLPLSRGSRPPWNCVVSKIYLNLKSEFHDRLFVYISLSLCIPGSLMNPQPSKNHHNLYRPRVTITNGLLKIVSYTPWLITPHIWVHLFIDIKQSLNTQEINLCNNHQMYFTVFGLIWTVQSVFSSPCSL